LGTSGYELFLRLDGVLLFDMKAVEVASSIG
jgi:hypothetical protein